MPHGQKINQAYSTAAGNPTRPLQEYVRHLC